MSKEMTNEERELVEEMHKSCTYNVAKVDCVKLLSVVKANIGKIITAEHIQEFGMVCPDCNGVGWYAQQVSDTEQEQRQCERCWLTGIVLKGA
jgi:hypothetical protein